MSRRPTAETTQQARARELGTMLHRLVRAYKVRARLAAHLRTSPVCISLFPPRDTLAGIAAAQATITARSSSKADHGE
jgi:hypothetical protein